MRQVTAGGAEVKAIDSGNGCTNRANIFCVLLVLVCRGLEVETEFPVWENDSGFHVENEDTQ